MDDLKAFEAQGVSVFEGDLTSEELVAAHYLMKALGHSVQGLNKTDLFHILNLYTAKLIHDEAVNRGMGDSCREFKATETVFDTFGLYMDARESQSSADSFCASPVVCYRCCERGHIARGCKRFRCFRCSEEGHVISGCRKKRAPVSPAVSSREGSRFFSDGGEESVSRKAAAPSVNGSVVVSTVPRIAPRPAPRTSLQVSAPVPVVAEAPVSDYSDPDEEIDAGSHVDSRLDDSQDSQSDCEGLHEFPDSEDRQEDQEDTNSDESDGCGLVCGVGDQDQDRPCWTYLSDELGFDCTDLCLTDFLSMLESDPSLLDQQSSLEIVEAAKEELAEVKRTGVHPYKYLYQ